jgi:hypothetical protein
LPERFVLQDEDALLRLLFLPHHGHFTLAVTQL